MTDWIYQHLPYIILVIICAGLAVLGMRAILGPVEDQSEQIEVLPVETDEPKPDVRRITDDAWEGFDNAHANNPPRWPQNDSWNEEFIPR